MLNTAAYAVEATVAIAVLHALEPWPTPAALYVAMAVSDVVSFTVVTVAIMLFERRGDAAAWWRPLSWLLPINLMATSFVLLAMAALWRSHGYLVLLAAVTVTFLASYRTYARLRGQHHELARLQELALSLPALTPDGADTGVVVEQARQLLTAERAALWLADGTLVQARDGAGPQSSTTTAPAPEAVRVSRPWRRPAWSSLVADITYDEGRRTGVLLVQERVGPVRPFDGDDRRLLEAVAALLGGGLDRGADRQRTLDAARRDPLTGLWTLPEASRQAAPVLAAGDVRGLLVVDIIALQDVNDSLGHEAGDAVLVLTAQRLVERASARAVTARIGGDELLVVLPREDRAPSRSCARWAARWRWPGRSSPCGSAVVRARRCAGRVPRAAAAARAGGPGQGRRGGDALPVVERGAGRRPESPPAAGGGPAGRHRPRRRLPGLPAAVPRERPRGGRC
jgi:GGDEF domain-containing protein